VPPPYVRTAREELLYEYAKLISRSAYGSLGLLQQTHASSRSNVIGIITVFTQSFATILFLIFLAPSSLHGAF
jgi:hypothetical protein